MVPAAPRHSWYYGVHVLTALVALTLVGVVALAGGVVTHGRLTRSKVAADEAWTALDASLERRLELASSLVAYASRWAPEERFAIKALLDSRAAVSVAEGPRHRGESEAQLRGSVEQLVQSTSSYPDLRVDGRFISLTRRLEECDAEVRNLGNEYNERARQLNHRADVFPYRLIASAWNIERCEYFQVGTGRRAQTVRRRQRTLRSA